MGTFEVTTQKAIDMRLPTAREELVPDILLFMAAFILLFWGLGARGLWGSEGRWAEVTREMFLTGDFFHPTIGGEPYFDKPLLTYWLIAAITATTGILNEWVARLPSAISGFLVIWATRDIGGRLWSPNIGRLAAWMLLTTYGFLFWSRTAAADMENVAAIVIAVAWYWSQRDNPDFKSFLVFYLILFLGALTKGLTAVVIPLVVILPDVLSEKRWRMLFKPSHWVALAVGLIIYLAPFSYASVTRPDYHESGIGLVVRENIIRFFKPFDHKKPFYIYLYDLPLLLLPWAPVFIAATAGSARAWKSLDRKTRWLVEAIALIFLFFTLSGSRRSYYILPIFPFCALLVAVFLNSAQEGANEGLQYWGIRIQKIVMFVLVAANLLVPAALPIIKFKIGFAAPAMLYVACLTIGLSGLILGRLVYKSREAGKYLQGRPIVRTMIVIATLSIGGYFCWQQNILDSVRTERPFAIELKKELAQFAPDRIGIYPSEDAKLSYYLDTAQPLRILKHPEALQQFLADEKPGILIMQRRHMAGIPPNIKTELDGMPQLTEKEQPWESKSSVKEKWVVCFIHKIPT